MMSLDSASVPAAAGYANVTDDRPRYRETEKWVGMGKIAISP